MSEALLRRPKRENCTSVTVALCRAHTLDTGLQDLVQSTRARSVFLRVPRGGHCGAPVVTHQQDAG
jgi:hypothetical protein